MLIGSIINVVPGGDDAISGGDTKCYFHLPVLWSVSLTLLFYLWLVHWGGFKGSPHHIQLTDCSQSSVHIERGSLMIGNNQPAVHFFSMGWISQNQGIEPGLTGILHQQGNLFAQRKLEMCCFKWSFWKMHGFTCTVVFLENMTTIHN